MGRPPLVELKHVEAAVAALRAEGKSVTIRTVRKKLGDVGSNDTIGKLLEESSGGTKDKTPESLRQLPPEVQRVLLKFADRQAEEACTQVAAELISCTEELAILLKDKEQLTATVEDVRGQLACAIKDRETLEGRVAQLLNELAGARQETVTERHNVEAARIEIVKLQLRLDALGPLEDELCEVRSQCEVQRTACAKAEQAAAVLDAQKLALDHQVQCLSGELANASIIANAKIEKLSDLLDREREARAGAERELAVMAATFGQRSSADKSKRKDRNEQAPLWQDDAPTG